MRMTTRNAFAVAIELEPIVNPSKVLFDKSRLIEPHHAPQHPSHFVASHLLGPRHTSPTTSTLIT